MSKRYTDTNKYKDSWFIDLEPTCKLFFYYLIDNVDNAGFYEISFRHIQFHLGLGKDDILESIKGLERGLLGANKELKNGDVIFLKNFIKHQLKMKSDIVLNPYNNYHKQVIDIFKSRIYFVKKYDFFNKIVIKGAKIKEGKIISEINEYLIKNLDPNKGLRDSTSIRERERERETYFGKSENLLKPEDDFLNTVCVYFSQTTEVLKIKVFNFLNAQIKNNLLDEFKKQTNAYMEFKNISGEQKHRWINYTSDWHSQDWVNMLKNYSSKSDRINQKKALVSNR